MTMGVFPAPAFTPITIVGRRDDHVVAEHEGRLTEYAIGHLPLMLRRLLTPTSRHDARFAGAARRTVLGILSFEAISDIHDEDPLICPVALNAIMAHSTDPARVLAEYRQCAFHQGDLIGEERGINDIPLRYVARERRLTIMLGDAEWRLERDHMAIARTMPQTIAAAATGRTVESIIDHPLFNGTGAVITKIDTGEDGSVIEYRAEPITASDAQGRLS